MEVYLSIPGLSLLAKGDFNASWCICPRTRCVDDIVWSEEGPQKAVRNFPFELGESLIDYVERAMQILDQDVHASLSRVLSMRLC